MRWTDKGFLIGVPMFFLFSNTNVMNYFHFKYPQHHRQIQLNTQAQFGSNAIHTSFINTFLTGNFIDNEMKASVSDQLFKSNNTLGFDWNTEVSFTNYNDTLLGKDWGYHLGISNRIYGDFAFEKNLFDLAFYGNKPFQGQNVSLAPAHGEIVFYQQFKLGFIKSFYSEKEQHKFGFSLSFINGNNRMMFDSGRMTMNTDSAGNFVDVSAQVQLLRTNPDYSYFLSNNGSGLAFDIGYDGCINDKHNIHLSVNDIGFIGWTRPGQIAEIDSNLHFTGVQINNIVTATGDEFTSFADSLNAQYVKTRVETLGTMMLPMNINFNYTYALKPQVIYLQAGIQTKMLRSFYPFIYAKGIFYPSKNVMLSAMFGYGGFSKFNFGVDIGFEFAKGYSLLVYSKNLEGVIPNTFGTGLSAGFRFNKSF
jgi:hypothetical protein